DASGNALPPTAPSFSALEAFGFPASPLTLPATPSGRPFDIRGSIGGQVLFTDNVRNSATNRQSDVGFTLLPSISASSDTARLRGSFTYNPTLTYYANTPSQNRINNFFTGNARATLIEDQVFLDLRAFGTVSATSGGFAPVGTPQVGTNNQVQSYAFQAAPYYVQRFGGFGTTNIGYAYRWVDQTGSRAFAPGSSTPFFTSRTTQANQIWAVFRSGEDFGRLLWSVRLIGSVFTGGGVYNDAHQYTASFQSSYAVNRWLAVLGEIGYEDARFSGINPYIVKEMIWGAGVRILPSEESAIIAAVRQRDGFISPFADVAMRLGPRTRLNGFYREVLSTTGAQSLDLLTAITYDALGNPIDRFAGSPIVVPFAGTPLGPLGGPLDGGLASPGGSSFGGSFLSTQNALMRMRTANVSLSQIWERDTLTLQYFYQETTPVAIATGTTAFQQSGNSVGLTWSHLLTDATSLSTYVSYGRFNTGSAGNSNTYTGRVLLAHRLSDTLFGSLQYVYSNRGAPTGGSSAVQNTVLATLRKAF
ncbi:MAG: TIGR03016 family PEP-CTERM system-associated outer membrane protein, partial [Acetobacteraceae bacterium]|nr:TIGR03016 family PEP-CTERM system-associated outer membrane protein [Acetobacteraceae bacterium]